MTILARTDDYCAEYESGLLTIVRRTDGAFKAFSGRRVAGEFRDCLKTHTPERVFEVWIKMFPQDGWTLGMYKKGKHEYLWE